MSTLKTKRSAKWTPALIRKLRGKRTQTEFGIVLGVPKNTIWRWEAGYSLPDPRHLRRLSVLAEKEHLFEGWKLSGSMKLIGDLEEASKKLKMDVSATLLDSLRRTSA